MIDPLTVAVIAGLVYVDRTVVGNPLPRTAPPRPTYLPAAVRVERDGATVVTHDAVYGTTELAFNGPYAGHAAQTYVDQLNGLSEAADYTPAPSFDRCL